MNYMDSKVRIADIKEDIRKNDYHPKKLHEIVFGIHKYPLDAIEIVGSIYKNSTTFFTGSHFGTTSP